MLKVIQLHLTDNVTSLCLQWYIMTAFISNAFRNLHNTINMSVQGSIQSVQVNLIHHLQIVRTSYQFLLVLHKNELIGII